MKVITKKVNVIDDFHGTKVSDPYRWLEKDQTDEVKEWIKAQNASTQQYLSTFTERTILKKKISDNYNYQKYSIPTKKGDYFYFHLNDGLKNQPIFYRTKNLEDKSLEVVLDPNALSAEGTLALTNVFFSNDGSKIAYVLSENGSDWEDISIMDLKTLTVYPETLKWSKFTTVTWKDDNSGFFYDRYPDPTGLSSKDISFNNKLYFHQLGTPQEEDQLIYYDEENSGNRYRALLSDDNETLIIEVGNGTEPENMIYYKSIKKLDETKILIGQPDAAYSFLGNEGSFYYFLTNEDAPNRKVIGIDLYNSSKVDWVEIIPEGNYPIEFVKILHQYFVVCSTVEASSELNVFNLKGELIRKVDLPEKITVRGVSGNRKDDWFFIAYESFLQRSTVLKYSFKTETLIPVFEPELTYNPSDFETTQVFYPSKDGTKIPMFLTYKKGLKLTGDNPVLLYSYGGYNICLTPSFSPSVLTWIQSGGIYAVANIRGGGEYGDQWHKAAILENRQVSFDDFIAAAEYLIEEKYSNPKRIAIMGGSNGGLLVATCIVQRPDLFGAGLSMVPVIDMLRFHLFTVGRFWTTEFGNAEKNKDQFTYLYKYSPLHNVKNGTVYPPVLITTGDTDDRVVPAHAYKFAATLQAAQKGDNPILLRVEKDAGHGLGKPFGKIIEEESDIYTFLFKVFEM